MFFVEQKPGSTSLTGGKFLLGAATLDAPELIASTDVFKSVIPKGKKNLAMILVTYYKKESSVGCDM